MRQFRKKFSLIEIISVVTIMGILFAVVLPNLEYIISNSSQKKCVADMKKIKEAVIIYREINSKWPEDINEIDRMFNKNNNDSESLSDPWGRKYVLGWLPQDPINYSDYDAAYAHYQDNYIEGYIEFLPISDFSIRPVTCDIYVFTSSEQASPLGVMRIGEIQ